MNAKKLGFGCMRLPLVDPTNDSGVDYELLCKMVDTYLERGFTYFDTAWMYCGSKSENAVKMILNVKKVLSIIKLSLFYIISNINIT